MEYYSKFTIFPVEIIERIIDHFQDDITTLTSMIHLPDFACTFPLCRKHLFFSVELYAAPGSGDIKHLLWCNSGIGHCVREVTLLTDLFLERWIPGSLNASADNVQTRRLLPIEIFKLLPKYHG